MMRRGSLALAITAAFVGGCVVDEARTEALRERRESAPPTLPSDPIASPVVRGTTASRVAVAVEPLGSISYDGLHVPIVSPDGRFVATQDAPAPPTWQRLALDRSAAPADGPHATVSISSLDGDAIGWRPTTEVFDLRAPVLLGRDASDEGVLVESPRPDGTRWIGIAAWNAEDARVRWLVREQGVAAHAIFGPQGSILYARRPVDGDRFVLVRQDRDGASSVLSLPDASLVFPLLAPDQRHASCLAIADSGAISLLLIDLTTGYAESLGRVVRRFDLSAGGGMIGAAQIVAASQSALRGLDSSDAMDASSGMDAMPSLGPIVFHPAMDRCVAIDAVRRTLVPLAPQSVAAVDAGDGRALCSTPDGLVLWTPGPQMGRGTTTRVLSEDYLPRRTANAARPFVLLAPVRRSATDLQVFGMAPAGP